MNNEVFEELKKLMSFFSRLIYKQTIRTYSHPKNKHILFFKRLFDKE